MKRKILFILDSSGSMIGTKINQVKTAMSEILSNLDKGDKFNIIQFAGDVTKWWNHTALVEVNQFSISAARNFINDIKADGCEFSCDVEILFVLPICVMLSLKISGYKGHILKKNVSKHAYTGPVKMLPLHCLLTYDNDDHRSSIIPTRPYNINWFFLSFFFQRCTILDFK